MRNLKRALSLLLSSTMVLGMVVMGGSAVGYQDVDASNDNQEAIEVLQAVGIMSGIDDAGNFDPDGSVTRNQMAVIMAHLLNLDYDYYRGTNTFSDVPEWAAPYVAACVAEGVTAGVGGGLYGGDQKITAAQASLMVMKALGYFQNQEDFGDDWQIATIRQASYINLFDRVNSNADAALTRGQVAQLVLNGLKAKMVDFTGDKGVQIGDVTVGYHAEYTPKTNAASKYNIIVTGTTTIIGDNGQYYVQLGEELYDGKLKLANGSDDFERPSRVWSYDGQEIGTYAKKELIVGTYTKGVTGKELYDLLTATTVKEYELANYVDGAAGSIKNTDLTRSNNNTLAKTGNGVLTEVYVDNDAKETTIVSVNTWLAQATADYNSNTESVTLKIFDGHDTTKMVTTSTTQAVDVEEVAAVANLTKDQFVLVNQSSKDRNKLEVVAVSDPKIMQDCTLTAFSKNTDDDSAANGAGNKGLYNSVTTGGTKYDGAKLANYDASVLNEYDADQLKNSSYNVYLDQYGYVIGVDLYEGAKNYVFITGYNMDANSNIGIETAKAAAIFTDGTMKQITVNVDATNKNITNAVNNDAAYKPYFDLANTTGNGLWSSFTNNNGEPNENKWYTYTVTDDGVYTLKPVKQQSTTQLGDIPGYDGTTGTIDCSKVYLKDSLRSNGDYAYGDDNSVYIVASQGAVDTTNNKAITEVDGVYTGVQEVKIQIDRTQINSDATNNPSAKQFVVNPIYTVYDSNGYVIASVVLGEAQGATKNYAYILSGANQEKVEDGVTYWTFDAIMGGKKVELTIQDKFGNTVQNLVPYSVQELMFDGDYVTKIKNISTTDQVNCALEQIDPNKHEIYDITFNDTYDGTSTANIDFASNQLKDVNAGTVDTDNTTITLGVRTLYTTKMSGAATHAGDKSEPVGLTFVQNAPAFVIQQENGKKTSTEYASVAEALGAMADANTTVNGQQFRGRIVAVLNDVGVAEWVAFISSTPVKAGSIITPPTTVTGGEGASWNNATKEVELRYYKDMLTDNEIKSYIGTLFGSAVTSMNKFMGTVTLADGTVVPVNFSQIEVVAISVDGSVKAYADVGVANPVVKGLTKSGNYIVGNTPSASKLTANASTGDLTLTGTTPASMTDIAVYTAYQVNASTGINSSTMTYKDSNNADQALTNAYYVAKGTSVTVKSTATTADYYQFAVNGTNVGSTVKGDGVNPVSYTTNISADSTFTVSAGYMVKVGNTELGVFSASDSVTFNGFKPGAKFAAMKNVVASSDNQVFSAAATTTEDSAGFHYTVSAGDAANGVIELVQVVEVTSSSPVATVAVATSGSPVTLSSSNKWVVPGAVLTITGTNNSGEVIKAEVNGSGSATAVPGGVAGDGSSTNASATWTLADTEYSVAFTQAS